MKTSQRGIDLIKQFEGYAAKAYLCPAGKNTIGYGHVIRSGEQFPPEMTEAEATALLAKDLEYYESKVLAMVDVPMTQHQFDALVSFCYNVGPNNFYTSTLLKYLNEGRYEQAADQFTRWNKVHGKPLAGLTRRREAERDLFLEEVV